MDKPTRQQQHSIPAALNGLIIFAQLAAVVGIFYGASIATHWGWIALLSLAFAIVGNSIYAVVHEAEHRILHPNRRVNDALGIGMAMLFPAPFHLIRQGHLGHHLRNRSDDEAFDFYFDGENRILKCLQWYGILMGLYYLTVVFSNVAVLLCPWIFRSKRFKFDRPTVAFMDSLNPAWWWAIRIEAAAAIALHVGIILLLNIPLASYAAVYMGFGLTWSAMQYVHHYHTERDVIDGSRNLRFWAPIDLIWLNHNWHRVHHRHPTVPWIYLSRLDGESADGLDHRDSLIPHYLRMWRGPRYSDEHVENKYAGRIIR